MGLILISDYINELTDLFDAFEFKKEAPKQDMMLRYPHYYEMNRGLKDKEKLIESMLDRYSRECRKTITEYVVV